MSLGMSQKFSPPSKNVSATRITNPPKIDGVLDDDIWQTLPEYSDFYMLQPSNDGPAPDTHKTVFKIAYDNTAVYLAAYMYDSNPTEILRQFSQRDNIGVQADVIGFGLNTYNDSINETRFYITSAGTIGDSKISQNNQDFSYDVVFDARASFDNNGWYAEFKIPYNALRFPEVDIQDWSINMFREIKHRNETHSFNYINREVGRETQYNATVYGVENIQPPVRLTFFPFAQAVVTNFDGTTTTDFSAGMDLKYGLSDSFTLDMTLVPDFGQAAFDEVRLNLGPFEQTFGENRQFFTEGTELFNKGRIFFSRRIGDGPTRFEELAENEQYIENPSRVNILNALKISGRTKDKLGIGFLNSITEETKVIIKDTITNELREVVVEPLANYNVFVLDQQFNGNSSISLTNTNVTREGDFRDANVSALAFDVADRKNTVGVSGRAIVSNVIETNGPTTGFLSELDIGKISGNFRYRFGHDFANTTYNINDLGLNFRNNFNNFVVGASYQIFEPTKIFNNYRIDFSARHRRLYKPDVQTSNTFRLNGFFVTKDRFAFGGNLNYETDKEDYFEPRLDGRFVTYSSTIGGRGWISTDFRKKFAVDLGVGFRHSFEDPTDLLFLDFSPRYRFSDKFLVVLSTDVSLRDKEFGYIADNGTDVFLGQRNRTAIENSLRASYNFDPFKAINLRFRNFWSVADYSDNVFFQLNNDGTRTQIAYDVNDENNVNPNTNFNIWNLDLSYSWRFAPGSVATLLYRNQIFNQDDLSTLGYGESLGNLFDQAQTNQLSLRVVYFIDYNNVKNVFKRKA